MAAVALCISIIALVVAYLSYTKSGGSTDDLKRKVEELHLTTEGLRSKLADALEKAEKKIRGEEKKPEGDT
ncbi:MAG: hypothetical protein JW832_12830 [Deltaproteobacteria bacterium]|nr:hypothetical protein [Deltaproteobacteria bacterium]